MSSPMFDLPEHLPMSLNAAGEGPADRHETVRWVCWCYKDNCAELPRQGYPSITCPRCGSTSYNRDDIAEGYCGVCHDWTRQQPSQP